MVAGAFVIIGFILLLLALVFALPFFGVGLIIPGVGDLIDIPLSFVMGAVGVLLIVLGLGIGFIFEYWWAILLFVIAYILLTGGKIWKLKLVGDS